MDIDFRPTDAPRVIGGVTFDRLDLTMNAFGVEIFQEYYAARRGNHIVGFILSYQNDTQRDQLRDVLDSIKFDD